MKKTIAIIALTALALAAHAASVTFPTPAYFSTNVFLHDAPSTPLHTRVPTGNILRATAGYIRPEQDLTLQGNFTLDTNKSLTLVNRDMDTGYESNGVVISANGTITLRKYLTGAGWSSSEITPTNISVGGLTVAGRLVVTTQAVLGVNNTAAGIYSSVAGGKNNAVDGEAAVVAGGYTNRAIGGAATVCGGRENAATGSTAAIVGGYNNSASGAQAYIGGGERNTAGGLRSTVSGGDANAAGGQWASVPGGYQNNAGGDYSLAGGKYAKATNTGSYVWGDSEDVNKGSLGGADSYSVHARGGFWHADSDSSNVLCSVDGTLSMKDANWTRTYLLTRVVTNIDFRKVTPPTAWHGAEMQDVGLTQRLIRAFGATTNDWRVIYSNP